MKDSNKDDCASTHETFDSAKHNFTSLSLEPDNVQPDNVEDAWNSAGKRRKQSPAPSSRRDDGIFKPFGIVETVKNRDVIIQNQDKISHNIQHRSVSIGRVKTQPFSDGYVDPYLEHPRPDVFARLGAHPRQDSTRQVCQRQDTTRTGYQGQRGYHEPASTAPRQPSGVYNTDRYVQSERARDPRTQPSSGFGIYRHMKPYR